MDHVIKSGERINSDHLPPSTISHPLSAGVEIKEEEGGKGLEQKFKECAGCLLDCAYAKPYNPKEKAVESWFKDVHFDSPEGDANKDLKMK